MSRSKKFKKLWTVISIISVIAMVFFTVLPAFY